ncbi:hypothetical protein ACI6PS_03595 [Flavobacterium sp. PLA-1-15]|uniref:hypothetical protein n=1 Tax=Flavobacterium sp. PLA-1-15 TaxID=3380533 RepID=UPI003B7F8F09
MAYKIDGSVLSDDMEALTGVEITEIGTAPLVNKTKTDENGKFKLTVASPETEIQISLFGYMTVFMKAKDFAIDSLAYLTPAVEVSGAKKNSNFWLYLITGVSIAVAGYYALKKPAKPAPKQVKIA